MEKCTNADFNRTQINEQPENTAPSKEKLITVILCLAAAAALVLCDDPGSPIEYIICRSLFALCTVAALLLMNKDRKTDCIKILTIGCFALLNISLMRYSGNLMAIEHAYVRLAVFALIGWMSVLFSNKTLNGIDRHTWPIDLWNAIVAFPISKLFIGIQVTLSWFSSKKKMPKEKKNIGAIVVVVIIAAILLIRSASLLMNADENFSKVIAGFLDKLFPPIDILLSNIVVCCIKLVKILIVKDYLCAAVIGATEVSEERLKQQYAAVQTLADKTKSLSDGLWNLIMGVFATLYIIFIVMQFSYLFGALMNRIPEGYLISAYAREGFFELCRVVVINFALLVLSTLTLFAQLQDKPLFKTMKLILLGLSILFATVSISKILLYIGEYGFTQLRIEGLWLSAVLLAACALWMIRILNKKEHFSLWLMCSMVTFSLISVVVIG